LVQTTHLSEELKALKDKENRLAEISADYETLLDALSEEDKEQDTIKEDGKGFVNAAVVKEAKQLKAEGQPIAEDAENNYENSYESTIIKVASLITEEKKLKKSVKEETENLHLLTKQTIEGLSDKQVHELLELKWISPLLQALNDMPETIINTLTGKVQHLAEKYAKTYADVVSEIEETEKALAGLIGELTGNEADKQGLDELKKMLNDEL